MHGTERTITQINPQYAKHYDAYLERQKRRKKRLVRRLILFGVITLLTFSFLTSYHLNQRALQAEMNEKYAQLEQQLIRLQKEEEDLRTEISLLKNDDYILEIARTNYFFSKDGELIFKIREEKPSY